MKKLFFLLILLVSGVNLAFAESHTQTPVDIPVGYTLIDSVISEEAAMLLVEQPNGTCSFWGCLLTDGRWEITKSTSLPPDADWFVFPAGTEQIAISLKETDGVGIYYNISLNENGKWYVDQILNDDEGVISFEETGLLYDTLGMIYGTCILERDITQIDWYTYPRHLNDVLKMLADDWGDNRRT